ncbi:MAG: hypothetical protein R2786_08605 [Flavobacteriaceae bacterium]
MSLFKRFLYYFGGFTIGILILFFFLGGKKASCDYGPEARTLKSIRSKKRVVQPEVLQKLLEIQLDTAAISQILTDGTVLFSESNTQLDSCKIYKIQGEISQNSLKITVENCNNKALFTDLQIQE